MKMIQNLTIDRIKFQFSGLDKIKIEFVAILFILKVKSKNDFTRTQESSPIPMHASVQRLLL